MKKLIFIVGLLLSLHVFADVPLEAAWKNKLRNIITSIAGENISLKLLGALPVPPEPEVTMPIIPKDYKKSTSVESYTKKEKGLTEYDKLPIERKRQFDYKFLEELFLVTRKTEAKDEDLANWLNTLDQGASREGIYQALVLDEVYSALEEMQEKPSLALTSFVLKFSQKFLNQTFKPETLAQLNLYSLKRILTEKSLDLLEYYETKNLDDFYIWYAIFSTDLAKDYGPFLKTSMRQDTRLGYHLEWAKGMPIQHIKSEFIIKLHVVMNALQLL